MTSPQVKITRPIYTLLQTDTSPLDNLRLNFSLEDQNSIHVFTCPIFDLTFRNGQAHAFCGQTNFSLAK